MPSKGKASAGGWDRAFDDPTRRSDVHYEAGKGRGMTHRNGRQATRALMLVVEHDGQTLLAPALLGDDGELYRCGANDPTPSLRVGDELHAVSLDRYRRTVATYGPRLRNLHLARA